MADLETTYKQMLTFSFMADIEEAKYIHENKNDVQENCIKRFGDVLNDHRISGTIGEWKCSPAINWEKNKLNEDAAQLPWITVYNELEQNLTTFFEHKNENKLVIAVAGTNFTSNFDWFTEDLETATLVPWNKSIVVNGADNKGSDENGSIATGTAKALHTTWNQSIDEGDYPQKTPIDYLKFRLPQLLSSKLDLYVTGHSLGGAIAPVLAQAIADHAEDWGLSDKQLENLNILTFPFAGPTPGDREFVDYVEKEASNSIEVYSTYNTNDVVPHAWMILKSIPGKDFPAIQEITGLFNDVLPVKIKDFEPSDIIVSKTVDMLKGNSEKAEAAGHVYFRWTDERTITGTLEEIKPASKEEVAVLGLSTAIEMHINEEKYDDVKTALSKITEITDPSVEKLTPFLVYFSSFLLLLAGQHINQYSVQVINDDKYSKALSEDLHTQVLDPIAIITALEKKMSEGFSILDELFLSVAGMK